MYKLVFLRHGQSIWNLDNRFTGWKDVELSTKGKEEAKNSGKLLKTNNFKFDHIYTSVLKRAIDTMSICLSEMNLKNVITNFEWRLNERHYGALQGLNKSDTAKKYGDKQVLIWRRSYDTPPPSLTKRDKQNPRFDKKYANLNDFEIPSAESLKDTVKRVLPLWEESIKPDILSKKKILIVAHGNSIRALIKYIDKISDKNIVKLNIPTGVPLVYEFDQTMNPIKHYYLGNTKEINKKTSLVKSQGRKSQ
jgi:2,3-bisphosphoglycerate-dependent phosphoglycerate mutase